MTNVAQLMAWKLDRSSPRLALRDFIGRIGKASFDEAPSLLSIGKALNRDIEDALRRNSGALAYVGRDADGIRLLGKRQELRTARIELRIAIERLAGGAAEALARSAQHSPQRRRRA